MKLYVSTTGVPGPSGCGQAKGSAFAGLPVSASTHRTAAASEWTEARGRLAETTHPYVRTECQSLALISSRACC